MKASYLSSVLTNDAECVESFDILLIPTTISKTEFSKQVCLAFLYDTTVLGTLIFRHAASGLGRLFVSKGAKFHPAEDAFDLGGMDHLSEKIRKGSVQTVQKWLDSTGGRLRLQTKTYLKRVSEVELGRLILIADEKSDLGIVWIEPSLPGLTKRGPCTLL